MRIPRDRGTTFTRLLLRDSGTSNRLTRLRAYGLGLCLLCTHIRVS